MPERCEVEFLPAWYPRLAQRRRQLLVTCGLAAVLTAVVGVELVRTRQQALAATTRLSECASAQTRQAQRRNALVRLSRSVDGARLLAMIDKAMPPDVTLTELTLEAEPNAADVFSLAYLSAKRAAPGVAAKHVRVQLRGGCGSPAAGANFVAGLSKLPFLQGVLMADAPATEIAGNEFRVSFWIDLSLADEEAPL